MKTTLRFPLSPETVLSLLILRRSAESADVNDPLILTRSPFGKTRASNPTEIVPDLLIRLAGVTPVTEPSMMAPAGMTVLPPTYTGMVTVAANLSPTCDVRELRSSSIRKLMTVPSGTVHVWSGPEEA
jgi:hypothetical protein